MSEPLYEPGEITVVFSHDATYGQVLGFARTHNVFILKYTEGIWIRSARVRIPKGEEESCIKKFLTNDLVESASRIKHRKRLNSDMQNEI